MYVYIYIYIYILHIYNWVGYIPAMDVRDALSLMYVSRYVDILYIYAYMYIYIYNIYMIGLAIFRPWMYVTRNPFGLC